MWGTSIKASQPTQMDKVIKSNLLLRKIKNPLGSMF